MDIQKMIEYILSILGGLVGFVLVWVDYDRKKKKGIKAWIY